MTQEPTPTASEGPPIGRRAFVEQIMGMPISVHLKGARVHTPQVEAVVARCFAHLREVDDTFSTWRSDSVLIRVRRGELAATQAHPWLAQVRDLCVEATKRTDGLFSARLPAGWGQPGHSAAARLVYDPTGLVKGWAIAGAADILATIPDVTFSIGAGGDIACGTGAGFDGPARTWRIGIENPYSAGQVAQVVEIRDEAVATSGSAARGVHVLDPRTGRPVDRPGSVTVIGPDITWADVWATAAYVDPPTAMALMARRDPAYRAIVN